MDLPKEPIHETQAQFKLYVPLAVYAEPVSWTRNYSKKDYYVRNMTEGPPFTVMGPKDAGDNGTAL
jgi:hypothetical protein